MSDPRGCHYCKKALGNRVVPVAYWDNIYRFCTRTCANDWVRCVKVIERKANDSSNDRRAAVEAAKANR